jgi:hypothetical protein
MIKNFNIKSEEFTVSDLVSRLGKAFGTEFTPEDRKTMEELMPSDNWVVRFELRKGNTELANGFRSFVLDETPWPRITCHMEDIETDDPKMQRITDHTQNNIWMIPTSYLEDKEVDETELEIKIDVPADATEPRKVWSHDIQLVKGPKTFKWLRNIHLATVQPGRYFRVRLAVEKNINRQHATYSPMFYAHYRTLDFKEPLPPCYTVLPEDYELGFHISKTCCPDPTKLVKMIWQEMAKRLEAVIALLKDFEPKSQRLPFYSDSLNVTMQPDHRIRYEFVGETYAIGNLINRYAFDLDPSIDYIACGDDHPDDQSILIKITHPTHCRLLLQGAMAALKAVEAAGGGL